MTQLMKKIAACNGYEALSQVAREWAAEVGIDVDAFAYVNIVTYAQLRRALPRHAKVFTAFIKQSKQFDLGFELAYAIVQGGAQ